MTRSIYSLWPWKPEECTATMEPDVVTGLVATASGSTTINLVWDADGTAAPNQATGYQITRSSDGVSYIQIATVTAPTLSYSDTSLSGGQTRYYQVIATNCADSANASSAASATTAAGSSNIPAAPSGFTATSNFADSVSLSWTDNSASPAEDGFDIEVSTNAGSTYSSVTTTAANAVSYSHTGRVESTAYLYRIRATNTSGSSSWVTASSVTTPAAVQSFTATAASSTQINLSWTDKSGVETGFRIERSTDNTNWSLVTTTAASATSYSNTGLTASTLYYYRIRSDSYNGTNNSAWYTASATTQSGSSTYNVEYLVIAGGGGGGPCAGGGAGGYKTSTAFSLTVGTSYSITIGAGGAGSTALANQGTDGNNSVFSTITSTGGGGGGAFDDTNLNGRSGGSGGGGGSRSSAPFNGGNGGAGTSGEGNRGGNNTSTNASQFCGGGGSSATGGDLTTNTGNGSAGGAGTASSISGSSVTRAGGGGGSGGSVRGAGGSGGGGQGSQGSGGGNTGGSVNTGGGGGGGWTGVNGGSGGSGVVILRMATANYSGTTTGSPTVTTSGTDTILTFNASGSYTA